MSAFGLALPEVHLIEDHFYHTKMHREFFSASWPYICKLVNDHNDRFIKGEVEYCLRAACPWTGEQLQTNSHEAWCYKREKSQ